MRIVAAIAVLLGAGCFGYTDFSSHQSARLLAPGKLAVGGAVGGAHYELLDNPLDAKVLQLAGMARRGLTPRLEGGLRLTHLRWGGEFSGNSTLLYADVKLSLLPDELALHLPLGVAFGDDRDDDVRNLQLAPALVHTATLSPTLELDSSLRLIASSGDALSDFDVLSAAATVGVRIRSDFWRFELHPEVGVMVDDLTGAHAGMPPNDVSLGESLTVGVSLGVSWLP